MLKSEHKKQLRKVKKLFFATLQRIDQQVIRLFSINGFCASLYYTFINPNFRREHLSVLRGRLAYQQSLKSAKDSSTLLRRNTHRLEKGLIMQPRRAIFARDYILETVRCYRQCVQVKSIEHNELKWAGDVLAEYFSVVKQQDRNVDKARNLFHEITASHNVDEQKFTPYPHQSLPEPGVGYDQLATLFKRRRSVRWYQSKSVPKMLIEQAVTAASLAPSACNRQPYRFVFLDDKEQVKEVSGFAMGTAGFAFQLPALFVVVGDLSCYPKERDRHVIYIDASLASMQLMLALETLGLSTCPINWPDIESREQRIAKRLNLKTHERVVMLVATGYALAEGGVAFSQKKNAKSLMLQNPVDVLNATKVKS